MNGTGFCIIKESLKMRKSPVEFSFIVCWIWENIPQKSSSSRSFRSIKNFKQGIFTRIFIAWTEYF